MARSKEQNYLHGAAIMTAGLVIIKILGAVYKIPIGNLLGDDGYALFYSSYSVYSVFLTLATAGFPVALSRMVSEARTQGRPLQARRTFSVAWWTFFILGAISTFIMFTFPEALAGILHSPDAALSIRALSPAVFLCCLISAYRGYTQGHGNMIPTTVSQILEVVAKVAVGLLLAWIVVNRGRSNAEASAAAIFGVVAGSLVALAYLIFIKVRDYKPDTLAEPDIPDSRGEILKNLARIGIPMALGSIILSFINVIDSSQCMGRLQNAAGFSLKDAEVLYGVYGKAQTIFNLPSSFIMPLTISVVPAIAAQIVRNNTDEAGKISEDSLRISMAISLPMGAGLAVLSMPIMKILYPDAHESGALLLCLLGIASIFVCFALMSNAVLQASGNERFTVCSIVAGGVAKIVVNWILVGTPSINIYGAPIGTFACYLTMCVMNLVFLRRKLRTHLSLKNIFLRPLLPCLIMTAVAYAVFYLPFNMLSSGSRMVMLGLMVASMAAAVVVYAVAVIKLRAITADDMQLIPKGDKIAKLLKMR